MASTTEAIAEGLSALKADKQDKSEGDLEEEITNAAVLEEAGNDSDATEDTK
jgi:hypothetical protein